MLKDTVRVSPRVHVVYLQRLYLTHRESNSRGVCFYALV